MDMRTLARQQALGRVAVGAAFVVAPTTAGRAWVGGDAGRPGARVIAAAFGVRDLALGLGAAYSLGLGYGARPWLLAGVAADGVDLLATLRAREQLPRVAATGSAALASASIALGLAALRCAE